MAATYAFAVCSCGMATETPEVLYDALLASWNRRNAAEFAALFEAEGHCIGCDGSEMHSPDEIESALGEIFADHETATYVAKIRDVRLLTPDIALLRAVVGMVPPGRSDINPDVNAVQVLVATRIQGTWRVSLLESTPAQYHGRPEEAEALTRELQELLEGQRFG